MSKRQEGESREQYRARCTAASKSAKKRTCFMRWPTSVTKREEIRLAGGYRYNHTRTLGTYKKETDGPIPELRFKKEGGDKANG